MCHIDIHTHILPPTIPNWAKKFGYSGFIHLEPENSCQANMMIGDRFFRKVESNCWSADERHKEMVETGIKKQVLSTVPVLFNYWAKAVDGYDTSRYYNDHIADVCSKHPDKFYGLGTLPMQDVDLACRELERCIKELGMVGVEIGTHINDWNLNEKALFPFYKKAEELNACIFVHPWDMMAKEKMERYWLPWLVGMPAESSLAICSLIFGGVFGQFPKLRFAFAHGGGSFPFTIGRIKHGFDVRPDLVAIDHKVSPDTYLGHFWVDSLVHDKKALDYNIQLFGQNRIAFGSDYPFPLGDLTGGKFINESDYPQSLKDKLMWKNALEWIGA
ncbi:MAG: amidohydrolase [Bacteroidetes bacterium]|jgi:aminocarboxymuconate-semialdehyde decarboxylase|nr:amidohydrolase [Bacteroidota bacterium]